MLTFKPFRDETPSPADIIDARMGLTQAEAAWVIGVDVQTWAAWEQGRNAMRPCFWDYFRVKRELAAKKLINIPQEYMVQLEVAKHMRGVPKSLWADATPAVVQGLPSIGPPDFSKK